MEISLQNKIIFSKNKFFVFVTLVLIAFFSYLALGQDADLKLLGVITDTKGKGVALIRNNASQQVNAFKLGEQVFAMGVLTSITRDTAFITGSGGLNYTLTTKLGGGFAISQKRQDTGKFLSNDRYVEDGFERNGNVTRIDASKKDRLIKQELPKLLMQASSEPVIINGEIIGFRMFNFEENSIYQKLGMQDGDIVKSINGSPLNNVARTIQLLNGMKDESGLGKVAVQVERNGMPVELEMNIVQ